MAFQNIEEVGSRHLDPMGREAIAPETERKTYPDILRGDIIDGYQQ